MSDVGQQLSSDELHLRQQQQHVTVPGPMVVAVGIQNHRNQGMIFRLCDAIQCSEILFVDTPPRNNRRVRHIARHSQRHVNNRFLTLNKFLELALPPLVALEITAHSSDLYATELPQKMALVVGGEQDGIPASVLERCQYAVHIPMFGVNSSMNVATALAIALYEWHRRFRV